MKKFIIPVVVCMMAITAFAQYAEYTITVPANTSTVILPPRTSEVTVDLMWSSGASVAQGKIIRVLATKQNYLVLSAGSLGSSPPTNTTGGVEKNGTATLIHCSTVARRVQAIVSQESDAEIWYLSGFTASSTNGGEFAYAKGQQYITDHAGAISVFSTSSVKLSIRDK